ncbi:hypothetical protein AJ80_09502 [Polytolypa hystricis UAMH7299]|uniref:Uncharacterized protein n=1 Tax=Polytolypa hystricis (strain UAMH7299) TaxID=1447883 RepID=A0A2B7WPG2_POLH7|nr:hypothetical protein AJ80_09502 [Polytolypa hystricis UAMH7299]
MSKTQCLIFVFLTTSSYCAASWASRPTLLHDVSATGVVWPCANSSNATPIWSAIRAGSWTAGSEAVKPTLATTAYFSPSRASRPSWAVSGGAAAPTLLSNSAPEWTGSMFTSPPSDQSTAPSHKSENSGHVSKWDAKPTTAPITGMSSKTLVNKYVCFAVGVLIALFVN